MSQHHRTCRNRTGLDVERVAEAHQQQLEQHGAALILDIVQWSVPGKVDAGRPVRHVTTIECASRHVRPGVLGNVHLSQRLGCQREAVVEWPQLLLWGRVRAVGAACRK